MGLGHVPAGPLPEEGAGDDVPRRQHRRAGDHPAALGAPARARLARFGEDAAARFLQRRRAEIVGRNLRSGRGEIDLVARIDGELVAVEVRTRTSKGGATPEFSFDASKAERVRRTAGRLGIHRVDLVEVAIREAGVELRWVKRAG